MMTTGKGIGLMAVILLAAGLAFGRGLERIRPSLDGTHFIRATSGERFVVWGVNYDHDAGKRLLDDYWYDEWCTVVEDFQEIKDLGANVVRIHLQVSRFMVTMREPNEVSLTRLARLVELAERSGLYLDVTGLGCYHKQDVPPWYDALSEPERWNVQERFWEAVARTCAGSSAIFCYDLMNEPILPGAKEMASAWLADAFDGKHFVQRLTLNLAGRTRAQVAQAWVDKLVAAIRKHDKQHMITVGVIPWVHVFPKARPLFYSPEVARNLDFVSVHFYPKRGEVDKAVRALSVYDIGKPLVVEEMFPLHCSIDELEMFVHASQAICDGWIGFYWGQSFDEHDRPNLDIAEILTRDWLRYFRSKTPVMTGEPVMPK